MFGKKETDVKPVIKTVSSSSNLTYLAEDCEIKGSIISGGNARIDGKIEGTVNIIGDLAIGQNAVLRANIEAHTISLAGEVHGNIKAKELLELNSSSRLYGDINTKQLKIDQGARFIGSSNNEENSIRNSNLNMSKVSEKTDNNS